MCWKGKTPLKIPKTRRFVDEGSPLFIEVMKHVPVLAPKQQALVGKDVRELSLQSMTGQALPEKAEEGGGDVFGGDEDLQILLGRVVSKNAEQRSECFVKFIWDI